MTEEMIEEEETQELDEVLEALPFLRITGVYPVSDLRSESVSVELHLPDDGDGVAVGESDPDDPTSVRSWVTDFCTRVLRELRSPADNGQVVMAGRVVELFAAIAENTADPDRCSPGESADTAASTGGGN